MIILFTAFFFILGLLFGSFANVCIARIPKEESVVFPGSHCPKCGKPIKWFDNLPVISYLILKARCRRCNEKISAQYPAVELITGTAFAAVAWNFAGSAMLPVYLLCALALIIISVIDIHIQIIPDSLSLGMAGLALAASPLNPELGSGAMHRLLNSIIGAAAGGGSLLLLGFIGEKVMGKEAMGGGDVKLLAGIGGLLGWSKVFSVLFIASLIGSVYGISMIAAKRLERRGYIPFGPFLSASAFLNFFLPDLAGLIFHR